MDKALLLVLALLSSKRWVQKIYNQLQIVRTGSAKQKKETKDGWIQRHERLKDTYHITGVCKCQGRLIQMVSETKAQLHGRLFIYHTAKRLAAFESGLLNSKTCVIVIGGLGDGFLTVDYYQHLSSVLKSNRISMVQCLLSSSYSSYGFGSVDEDALELNTLIKHMVTECHKNEIYLMGHSTGCQDIIKWSHKFYSSSHNLPLNGIILQAPVSDREYLQSIMSPIDYAATLALARHQSSGKYMNETILGTGTKRQIPITTSRWLSLYGPGGDEDYFSMDLSLNQWKKTFAKIHVPIMVLLSTQDEYYPRDVDFGAMVDRFSEVNPHAGIDVMVVDGKHADIWDSDFYNYIVSFVVNGGQLAY